jgi:hypothetical protein
MGYPAIQRLQNRYRARGVQAALMAGVEDVQPDSTGGLSTADVAAEIERDRKHWIERYKLEFPIGIVTPETRKKPNGNYELLFPYFFDQYGITGWPTYMVFDREGRLRYVQMGVDENLEKELAAVIERLLAEPPKSGA